MDGLPATFPQFPAFAPGEVWLVGAGPGDPRLLTVMAIHALRSASAVIHDALIDRRILDLADATAGIYPAGKRGGKPSTHQRDISEFTIALASQGEKVVRLKGGDPFVFGRGAEEVQSLARAGVRFRIVPGLTSGLSAAALAGIPATARETNHAIILATGHRAAGDEAPEAWEAIARTGQPVILYMALSHLAEITASFERAGMSPAMPVTIVASATFANERVLHTRLATASADARANNIEPPAIIIVGSIAGLRPELLATMVRES
jgi:uroporphyrin-III C-methyltransferase